MTEAQHQAGSRWVWRFLHSYPASDHLKAAALLLGMVLGAALESVGIGLLMPFAALLVDTEGAIRTHALGILYSWSGRPAPLHFAVGFGVAICAIVLVKNCYLAVLTYTEYRFLMNRQLQTFRKLFRAYIGQPYSYFLARNSALLLRNVTYEVDAAWAYSVVPSVTFATEFTVALAILALLFFVAPVAALFLVVLFGGIGAAFFAVVRRRLAWASRTVVQKRGELVQWTTQAFATVKETKVLQREQFFDRRFHGIGEKYVRALRAFRFTNSAPQYFVESLGIAGVVGAGCLLLLRGSAREALPTVGLFAIAAVRLMSAANRIVTCLTSMKNGAPSLRLIVQDLESAPRMPAGSAPAPPLPQVTSLQAREVAFQYEGADRGALSQVSFAIRGGEKIAIVGPSGAGKTTLIDLLLGLLEPTSGEILVNGRPLREVLSSWRSSIGYIPQHVTLLDDTIRHNIAFGREDQEIDDAELARVLRISNLAQFVAQAGNGVNSMIGENGVRLSGGERQRIGIARALYGDPPVLIMDEATSALDSSTEKQIQQELMEASRGKLLLVIAHRLTTVRRMDRILLVSDGRLEACGSYDELLRTTPKFEELVRAGSVEAVASQVGVAP